ncbi:MAG: 30S ribosomal protein S12 methylthiotransferase RimO [Bacilli bacterium]
MKRKKVGIVSLGCNKNQVDSENILGLLEHDNYEITNNPLNADIIIINTCGFIESSKKESIETIFEMAKYHKKLVVCGCLAERYFNELKQSMPEVDLFIPIKEYYRFNELLKTIDDNLQYDIKGVSDKYRVLTSGPVTSYLRIGDGCDNCCTYCAIPLIRGRFHSRLLKDIVSEAHVLANKGIKEIVVLEQDTSKYGIDLDGQISIVDVLKELLKIESFEYIRLLYLYPDEISDELIDLIAKEKRLTPYFDIPIQHSEDKILKAMNRRGNKKFLLNLFNKIKEKVPNAVLRTTVMVGFPNESEEDVDQLIKFIEEIKFDHLGAFTFSKEEGTKAYRMRNQIQEDVKQNRLDRVLKAQQKISYQKAKTHLNEVMEGLVVGFDNECVLARSYWNAPDDVDGQIYVKAKKSHKLGDKIIFRISQAFVYDLFAEEQ